MVKKVILGVSGFVLALVVILSVVVAMQPADFEVKRSVTINASPDRVFKQVNDFHNWDMWSPWAKIDPNMKVTYSGPAAGVGASYLWTGNDEVGEGKMTIAASHPNEHIAIDLEFIKPFPSKNLAEFMFRPEGTNTNVTWSMAGQKNFVMKAFCMVMDMDKMVGADFEKGLAQMKTLAESAPVQ